VPPSTTTYVVTPGDNLWTVSAAHLAAMTNQPAGSVPDAAVASYWQRVCDVNRSQLQSGNVNLIFPGEQIDLPPAGG
jgi:nucleoid-associated protein YgaU